MATTPNPQWQDHSHTHRHNQLHGLLLPPNHVLPSNNIMSHRSSTRRTRQQNMSIQEIHVAQERDASQLYTKPEPIEDSDYYSGTENAHIEITDLRFGDLDGVVFHLHFKLPEFGAECHSDLILDCIHDSKLLGRVTGHFIDSEKLQDLNLESKYYLNSVSKDCQDLATTIFNIGGVFKRKWTKAPLTKGTGVWRLGTTANILVIETIEVAKDFRLKGMGKRMFESILFEAEERGVNRVFVWPTELSTAPDSTKALTIKHPKPAVFRANKRRAINFWRSLGFRRVGISHWFCYATQSNHASRRLATEDDLDLPEDF